MFYKVPLRILIGFAALATSGMLYAVLGRFGLGPLFRPFVGAQTLTFFLCGLMLFGVIYFTKLPAEVILRDAARLKLFALAILAMVMPPWCYFGWRAMVYTPRNAGLALTLSEIPGIRAIIVGWVSLACALLCLAAWFLRVAKRASQIQDQNVGALRARKRPFSHSYVACLAISIVGCLLFLPFNFVILLISNMCGYYSLVMSAYFVPAVFLLILIFAAIPHKAHSIA